MNRAVLGSRRAKVVAESPFWISYADLMTSMTILLLLLVSAFLLQVAQEQKVIDEHITVKKEIIDLLLNRLGRKYPVTIDRQTGAVTIDDQILFGFNDSALSDDGKDFLRRFVPDYVKILLGERKIREHIAQVFVEGHTDAVGSYASNMQLSLSRAYSVTEYLFSGIPAMPQREDFRGILTANGRSFMDGKATDAASRRVEFKFRLKDWDVVKSRQIPLKTKPQIQP